MDRLDNIDTKYVANSHSFSFHAHRYVPSNIPNFNGFVDGTGRHHVWHHGIEADGRHRSFMRVQRKQWRFTLSRIVQRDITVFCRSRSIAIQIDQQKM